MDLKITTLARLPENTDRLFFVYFLDYGWDDELTQAMYANFDLLAGVAAENRSLLLSGLNRTEFANEVLSWHRINGEPADELLPAIMITDVEPRMVGNFADHEFGHFQHHSRSRSVWPERFLLIPLREVCRSAADVTALLQKLAADLRSGRPLSEFEIRRVEVKNANAASDMIVLQPNIAGIGIDLKEVFRWSKARLASLYSGGRQT